MMAPQVAHEGESAHVVHGLHGVSDVVDAAVFERGYSGFEAAAGAQVSGRFPCCGGGGGVVGRGCQNQPQVLRLRLRLRSG